MSDEADVRNWKLYEASKSQIDILNKRQGEEDDKTDKWMMTIASGSFGLSFAFINQIVPIQDAVHILLLILAWSCFLGVLILEIIAFMVSSFCHSVLAKEEDKILKLKYRGIEAEHKERNIFLSLSALFGYVSIFLFIGGSLCLILFIAKNLL